jgi:hypothetical protein
MSAEMQPQTSQLDCVRTFWTMVSPSNVPITCALYRTPAGFELRAGQGEQDLLLRQPVLSDTAAGRYAAVWKAAAEAKGFHDVAPQARSDVSTRDRYP